MRNLSYTVQVPYTELNIKNLRVYIRATHGMGAEGNFSSQNG